MSQPLNYVDLGMRQIPLAGLDKEERQLIRRLQRRAREHPDWNDFDNYSLKQVAAFYEGRGLSRSEVTQTAAWRIAQDLSGRLGIAAGWVRPPDFLGELMGVVYGRYRNLRAFCEATGLSEELVRGVLAGRKQIAFDTLDEALSRIGYAIRILPVDQEIAPERQVKSERAAQGAARRTAKRATKGSRK
jgi:hypothetical protein